jgi:hypothetical protein
MEEVRKKENPLFKRVLRSRLFWAAAVVITAIILFVALSPYLIRSGVERALLAAGANRAEVKEADLDLFSGTLTLKGVSAGQGGEGGLEVAGVTIRFAIRPLFQKKFLIERVRINGAEISIERLKDGSFGIAGLEPAPPGPVPDDKGEGTRGAVWLTRISAIEAEDTLVRYVSGEEETRVKLGGFKVSGPITLSPGDTPNGKGGKGGKGADGGPPSVTFEGSASASSIEFRSTTLEASEKKISWKGSIRMTAVSGNPSVMARGSIKGSGPVVKLQGLSLKHDGLTAKVNLDIGSGENTLLESVTVSGLELDSPERGLSLLGSDSIGVEKIGYGKNGLTIEAIRLEDFHAGRPEAGADGALFVAKGMTLKDVLVARPLRIETGPLELEGVKALIRITPGGGLYMVRGLDLTPGDGGKKAEKGDGGGGGVGDGWVRISGIRLLEGGSIRFEDESVDPPYRATLLLQEAEITDIDTAAPEASSKVTVTGTIDEYTLLSFTGSLKPFRERLTLELDGRLEALDLPPLSSYSASRLGYGFKSGHLTAGIKLKIISGKIDGTSELELKNLDLAAADEGGEGGLKKLTSELTMPLPTALNLMRDRSGNIRLTVPVSGDIKDPKFDIGDAINQAVGRAVKKAAIGYLKYYFQPYGTLITVAQLAGKAAKVRLDPVIFQPGGVEPDEGSLDYLERVAGFLKDRPGVQIRLCGTAVHGEPFKEVVKGAATMEEGLKALARERAAGIKDHLVSAHGVPPERLFVCDPELAEGAEGRVELLI